MISKERLEGNGTEGFPILPFSLWHHFHHNWLTTQGSNTSKEHMVGFPGCWCFLEHYYFPPMFCNKFWFDLEVWSFGTVRVLLLHLHSSVLDVTYLLCLCFEFCWTPMHRGFNRISCSWDTVNAIRKWGWKEWELVIPTVPKHTLCCPVRLHVRNTSSKIKLLRISKQRG